MAAIFYPGNALGTRLVGDFKWPVFQPQWLFSDVALFPERGRFELAKIISRG